MQYLTEFETATAIGVRRETIARWRLLKKIEPQMSKGKGTNSRYFYASEYVIDFIRNRKKELESKLSTDAS